MFYLGYSSIYGYMLYSENEVNAKKIKQQPNKLDFHYSSLWSPYELLYFSQGEVLHKVIKEIHFKPLCADTTLLKLKSIAEKEFPELWL